MSTPNNFSKPEDSAFDLSKIKPPLILFYMAIVLFVIGAFISLFYIKTDISVHTVGVTRPNTERTEVKSLMSGVIQVINFKEGSAIRKDNLLAYIQDNSTAPKKILNDYELSQRQIYINDLELLTTSSAYNDTLLNQIKSPQYKQQLNRFIHQLDDHEAKLKKVTKELVMNDSLISGGIISKKDSFDKQIENTQIISSLKAFKNEQLGNWQQELSKYKIEVSQFIAQDNQISQEGKLHEIRAPISGIIQGINNKYAGGVIQAGETVCVISPETELVAECSLPTRDIGLIKINQEVKYQIDAFDYKYFGILKGKVVSIDNDFSVVDNKPIFKVRCSFDSTQVYLKNGFTGKLKKGLTFQARCTITQRTLWQLLFDKIDDWLNPNAPIITQN